MKLFILKRYRPLYILIYILFAAIYPFSEIILRGNTNTVFRFLSIVSGYILPFYLYLFLSILLFDLFLLINHFIKLVSVEVRRSFSFRCSVLSTMIFLSVAVVVGGVINLNTIRVSEYKISVPKKNSHIAGLRVAFVADFHIQQNMSIRYVEQFVRKVNALKPDIMLYGGDILEGDRENEASDNIESALRTIHTKYGSFGVLGNHEFYGGQQKGSFFKKAHITILRDSVIDVDNSFYLAGRLDQRYRNRENINELLNGITPNLPIILLDHRPTELQEVSNTAVNVQFSGHTHNGQLFPLNYIIHQIYELSWGYKKINNTHFFVTSGLRLWGPPVKTAGKSEIMLVYIRFE